MRNFQLLAEPMRIRLQVAIRLPLPSLLVSFFWALGFFELAFVGGGYHFEHLIVVLLLHIQDSLVPCFCYILVVLCMPLNTYSVGVFCEYQHLSFSCRVPDFGSISIKSLTSVAGS